MGRLVRAAVSAAFVVVLAAALVACGGGSGGGGTPTAAATEAQGGGARPTPELTASPSGGAQIDVTEREYSISLSQPYATAGKVTFNIKNDGTMAHEFVIIQTDLSDGALPVDTSKGEVKESAGGLKVVDEKEDIAAGSRVSLSTNLKAGNYVFICNVPGHYQLGMHTGFTVTK
jgi:uncharacterized cupredoxin-like copper-binding protein